MNAIIDRNEQRDGELPNSIEAEQHLLGTLLLQNRSFDTIGTLTKDQFFEPLHGRIFEAIAGKVGAGQLATPVTIAAYFENEPSIRPDLTAKQYLGQLIAADRMAPGAAGYADTIREYATRRELIVIAQDLMHGAWNATPGVSAAVHQQDASRRLDEMAAAATGKGRAYSAAEAGRAALLHHGSEAVPKWPTTGLHDLDRITGGWPTGQLTILAGRTGMGKSAISVSSALAAAQAGIDVLMFSLEMQEVQIGSRLISSLAYEQDDPLPYQLLINREQTDEAQYRRLLAAEKLLAGLPLRFEEQRGLSIADIVARTRAYANSLRRKKRSLGIVFVDHIGLIRSPQRQNVNRVRELAEITDGLATLAKDIGTAVVGLAQLNREVEKRTGSRPQLSDLRDSGAIEEDASLVVLAYRPAYYLAQQTGEDEADEAERLQRLAERATDLELIIAKNRNGESGVVDTFCDIGSNVVTDLAR